MDKNISGKKCVLVYVADENGFALLQDGVRLKSGPDARKLSEWALREGAAEVAWCFDLKLTDR